MSNEDVNEGQRIEIVRLNLLTPAEKQDLARHSGGALVDKDVGAGKVYKGCRGAVKVNGIYKCPKTKATAANQTDLPCQVLCSGPKCPIAG